MVSSIEEGILITPRYGPPSIKAWTDWPPLYFGSPISVLIHRGDMDFHAFYDLFSGVIIKTYESFSFYFEPLQEDENDKNLEWFIWLADRIIEFERDGSGTPPAHIAFRDWKPPNRVG